LVKEKEKNMRAIVVVDIDSSAELSREQVEDILKVLVSVAELSSVVENVHFEVVEK
jgi:hypothetical protein